LQYTFKTHIMGDDAPQDTPQQAWWDAFPEPKAECPRTDPAIISKLIEVNAALGKNAKRDFLLVDVRRTDWEGGTIATSINLPAHTFYQTRPQVYQLVKQAGVKRIIFYCGKYFIFSRGYSNMLLIILQEAPMAEVHDALGGCKTTLTRLKRLTSRLRF
jgi:hypothetical protein